MSADISTLHDLILNKKLFLWDFDGCLCDSERVHFLSYAEAFAFYGHTLDESEYYQRFSHTGLGAQEEIRIYGLPYSLEEIRQKKNEAYWNRIQKAEAKIFPEVPEILERLEHLGIQNIVASNSPQHELDLILSQTEVSLKLHGVFGLFPGLRKKPAPDIFLHALEEMGGESQFSLVLEDSERGLLAAAAAHMPAFWLNTFFSQNFSTEAPYLWKPTHAQLLELLKGIES